MKNRIPPLGLAESNEPPPDLWAHYLAAVQDPTVQIRVLAQIFARCRPGRKARVLREDFAGTCADSVAWVASKPDRLALAVERDGPTLAWAKQRAERVLRQRVSRLQFIEADVLSVKPSIRPEVDLLCALNFSLCHLPDRKTLRTYFRRARRSLSTDGIFVANAFGGPGAMTPHTETHTIRPAGRDSRGKVLPDFEYHWEVRSYDAVTGRGDYRIHFVIPNPHAPTRPWDMRDAFRYDWRLWTLPEWVELMYEAGFHKVEIWRHTYDPLRKRNGVFLGPVESIPNQDTWVAYVVGL